MKGRRFEMVQLVQTEESRSMMAGFRAWRGRHLSWELSHSMDNEVFLARAITKRPSAQTQRELARAKRRTIRLRRKLDGIVAKSNISSH